MMHNALSIDAELPIIMAIGGFAFGLFYFMSLKRSVTLFVGGKSWLGALALTLGRIGACVVFLYGAARLGAAPLLAAFAGFLTARALALRAERKAG
jgi:N-ATPase, AtpR subunit